LERKGSSGTWPNLVEGGTVASSMLGIGDGAIKVTIENKPTYFGRLELREIPATPGKDMLEPASLSLEFPSKSNNIAVFPDPNRAYCFNLAPNAGRGQVEFRLYSKDNNQSIAPTDSRGLAWINAEPLGSGVDMIGDQPMLYPTKDEYPTQGKTHSITVDASPCAAGYDCHDQLTYLATPQGTTMRKAPGTPSPIYGYAGLLASGPDTSVCVQVTEGDNLEPGQVVTFSALPSDISGLPDLAKEDFINLRLSIKQTMTDINSPSYKLPFSYPFIEDDLEDGQTTLQVKTNDKGYACVGYYPGNVSNFIYKIRATYGAQALDFSIQTEWNWRSWEITGDYAFWPATAMIGQTLDIGAMFKNYWWYYDHCTDERNENPAPPTCIIEAFPMDGQVTWSYSLNHGAPVDFMQSDLDSKGRAGMQWLVGRDPRTPWLSPGDHFEIYVDRGYEVIPRAVHVDVVSPESVKIKMERVMMNSSAPLPEGGTVASSFFGQSDEGVKATIENQPSFFMAMEKMEQPYFFKRNMFLPAKPTYFDDDENPTVIFPKEMKSSYFYPLATNAPAGNFSLNLLDIETGAVINSTSAKIKNDYLLFSYSHDKKWAGRGVGPLQFMTAAGSLAMRPFQATSGTKDSPHIPPLPDSTCPNNAAISSYISRDQVKPHWRTESRRAFCDNNYPMADDSHCWSLQLLPESVYDCSIGSQRKYLSVHPRGGNTTLGCIGIDPVQGFPLSNIRDSLQRYLSLYGPIAVEVQGP